MLSLPERALFLKLCYFNQESAVVLRNLFSAKGMKTKYGPTIYTGIMKLVKWFEESDTLVDRPQCGIPELVEGRII
ncbi:hypothetical protein TNCV_4970291 [Trichonephila clavipes]|nr:hypothetical protein TNCV_4970291 [Trichonephila clavipes]